MAKAKPKSTLMVADGAGGMVKVQDRRFEAGNWPIRFEVAAAQSDTWFRYFYGECEKQDWSSSGIGQLEARENSGSITVSTGTPDKPQFAVIWDWKREGAIKIHARSDTTPEMPLAEMQAFFARVNERCRSGATERCYRRGQLQYDGLPWLGEVWLSETLRLAPPSKQDETALLGPRVVLVDTLVDAAGQRDAGDVFGHLLRELSVFLSVVMGSAVRLPEQGRAWTWTIAEWAAGSEVRSLGYIEPENPPQMPDPGASRSMPLRQVNRPDFSERGIDGTMTELSLSSDAADLWAMYRALTPDRRRDFLQAAAKWQEAMSQRLPEGSTLSFALMVVACESLKPSAREFRDHTIYEVVEALLGRATADWLREQWFRPQYVRSSHLHRGEFHDSEYVMAAMMGSYKDPTFYQARRELWIIAQAAMIEWLRRGGNVTMPVHHRRKNLRRSLKEHAVTLLPASIAFGLAVGLVLGVFLQSFYG
jgi:hypothetical protein